jgi:uncharacterized protein (DUF1501 family)
MSTLFRRQGGHTLEQAEAPAVHRADDASPVHYQCDCGQEGEIDPDPWRKGFTRRKLIQGGGYLAAAGLGTQLTTVSKAFAQTPEQALDGRCIVNISLRGGWDSLNVVVPHADAQYYGRRPNIAVPKSQLLAPDELFGFNPAMKPLIDTVWSQGVMAAVHACGLGKANYSHFDAMRIYEQAVEGSGGVGGGWVNRLIAAQDLGTSPFETGIQFGGGMPYSLQGAAKTLSMNNLGDFKVEGDGEDGRLSTAIGALYGDQADPLAPQVKGTLEAVATAQQLTAQEYQPAVQYPDGGFANALRNVAQTIKAQVGLRVACVDVGGWDTHTAMGNGAEAGSNFNRHVADFAAGVAAFCQDLGDLLGKVTIVTSSEFGRRPDENDSNGCDHGYGQAILCIGGGVKGGYYAQWPTLADGALTDSNLAMTTDYRSVLTELCRTAGNVADPSAAIFPGFKAAPVGVFA